MNKYKFIFKFIANKPSDGKYNFNLLFPFAGVIIGCITVALTLSIMEGMEYAIFNKLEQISFSGKLENISIADGGEIKKILESNGILFQKGIEDQIIIMNEDDFRLVTIHGIDKFEDFKDNILDINMHELTDSSIFPKVYIGKSLSIKLDISVGDTVKILHPKNINIFTGLPDNKTMVIGGIFQMNIIDYDQQHIFCQYYSVNHFLPENKNMLYLSTAFSNKQNALIKQNFPEIQYTFWKEKHQTFISAMEIEKFTFTIIGFLIVCIAGFTLMSMMSLSVMQKVPQIGILRALGMGKNDIGCIFIFQAIATSIVSSIIGILLSYLFIYLDEQFNLIQAIFPSTLFFDFPLILKMQYILLIFIISLILMIISGLYPSFKAAGLDPVQSIQYRR